MALAKIHKTIIVLKLINPPFLALVLQWFERKNCHLHHPCGWSAGAKRAYGCTHK